MSLTRRNSFYTVRNFDDLDEIARARAVITAATARGFVREGFPVEPPELADDPGAVFLWDDAADASDYLADLEEPDCCPECGTVDPCDCVTYLVPR